MDTYDRSVVASLLLLCALGLGLAGLQAGETPRTDLRVPQDTQEVPDTDDLYYENLRVLDPVPKAYFGWAKEVIACLQEKGREVHGARIKFFIADTLAIEGDSKAGVYYPAHIIILREKYMLQSYIVKHEIVHAVCADCSHDKRGFLPCTGRP